jgi:excisionase family DNA binding protein
MSTDMLATQRDETLAEQVTETLRSFASRVPEADAPRGAGRGLPSNQLVQRTMTSFVKALLEDNAIAHHQRTVLAHLLLTANLLKAGAGESTHALALGGEVDDPLLSSEVAAKLLHVSRTHINMLMDTGKLGEITRTHGGHRRISRAAVLEYKTESKRRRANGMKAMVEATDRLGLYDAEAAELRAAMKGKRA